MNPSTNLALNHVGYTYPGAVHPALHDVSAAFPAGWTGVVGDNGCGKTTVAMIAVGLLDPDEGSVTPWLYGEYCPQDSSAEPATLYDFACDWDRDAVRLRQLLSIGDDWPWRYDQLSGGQQKRLQVACCLWRRPDLLVMDEPTNDLDSQSRAAICRALDEFKGIGLLISHDRQLLDDLVSQCLVFENGAATMRPGGYTKAMEQAGLEAAAARHARDQARKEAARIQDEARRRNEEAQRSKSRLSARDVGKHDGSMRDKLGRAKVSDKDGVAGRASSVMSRRLSAAQAKLEASPAPKRYDYRFEAIGAPAASKTACHIEETVLAYGSAEGAASGESASGSEASEVAPLSNGGAPSLEESEDTPAFALSVPELWVSPTDHVGITGPNGSGKSTLLRHALARIPEGVRVAYVPQDVSEARRSEVLRKLCEYSQADMGQVLSHVARLNSDPKRIIDGEDVSPGEMRKLILAELLLEDPNVLVLDEPTNHLDVGSIEALQGLVRSFAGAVLLVSHDMRLVDESCTVRWMLEETAPGRFSVRAE